MRESPIREKPWKERDATSGTEAAGASDEGVVLQAAKKVDRQTIRMAYTLMLFRSY
jgi:hypothetical protein